MVNTSEEIMLTLQGHDNASQMFANVDRNAQSMASNISSAMSKVNTGLMSIGQVTDNLMQSLTGKSAMDTIFGTASKAETNKVLLKNMLEDVEKNYESFYDTVDKTTDSSLTSMQELIPALNALNAATGATDKELENITPNVANFGAAVLAQTGSVDRAQQAMMDLSKGYKGAFASLDQYGITEDSLKRAGWEEGESLEKYMDAVSKVIGSTEELMETNQGLDALIGKSFSRAGKKIGNEFLPIIKDVKRGFIEMDNEMGGAIASTILLGTAGVESGNRIMWNITTAVQGTRDLVDAFKFVTQAVRGTEKAVEGVSDAINTVSNVSDMGAGLAGAGGAVGAGANIAKEGKAAGTVSKITPEIADAAAFASAGFGYNAESSIAEIEKYAGTYKKAEKDALRIIDEANDDGLSDYIRQSFSKKGKAISNSVEQGGASLHNGLRKLSDIPHKTSTSLSNFSQSFTDSITSFKDAGVKGNLKKLDQKLLTVLKGTDDIADTLNAVDDVGDISKTVTGAEGIAEGMTSVAGAGATMGAAAPEMEAAAAGTEAASVGATSLSAAFTSMIVPALALAATLLIMIPIFAVVAAEAMIVIRLLAELMEALSFDSINLDGAVKGISSVATALAWIGVAMLALTAVNITTQIAMVTSFFMGLTGPLEQACDALMKAAGLLRQFSTVSIDESVATNLKTISDSLMSISSAMMVLTWSNITTGFSDWIAGALGFGSVTEGLAEAKEDIIKASTIINEFSGITPLDESVANNIQNVCDSLASVGNAMSALRSIRDGQNWDDLIGGFIGGIFGEGVDIQTALLNVKDDIIKASQSLAQFTGITDVPEDVADKIKKVSDTLTSVNDAFNTLRGMRDDSNWDEWMEGIFGGTDIASALEQIKTDLMIASQKLAELSGLSEITEDTTAKIGLVGDAITKVSEVCTSLSQLPPMEDFDSAQITTAVTNVQTAATELAKLNETTFDGASADTVLGSIQTTLENVKTTLAAAAGFSEPATNIGSQIVSGVQSGLSPLTSTITGAISSACGSAASAGWTGGSTIGTSTTGGFKSALKLADVMSAEMGHVKTAVDNGIDAAKTAAENGAEEVVAAFKSGINVGSPGDIARAMKQEMIYTNDFILGSISSLKGSSYAAARGIVESFGNPALDIGLLKDTGALTADIGALKTTVSNAPESSSNKYVTVIFEEGAIPIDARNYTKQDAQALVLSAMDKFESF